MMLALSAVVPQRTSLLATALALGATGALVAAPASAAPSNDDFANAVVLPTGGAEGQPFASSRVGATAQAGEPRHAGDPDAPSQSVWWSWRAPYDARVEVRTATAVTGGPSCYDWAHDLAVYTGATLTGLTAVGSDIAEFCDYATVTFAATAGTTYRIAVDSAAHTRPVDGLLTAARCTITGTSARETLVGTAGDDVICGGGGDDLILAQGGDDTVVGGLGIDAVSYADATAAVTADLTTGRASGQGSDILGAVENLIGSRYDDKLDGSAGPNTLNGGAGADSLWGQSGNDVLFGADGDDTLGGGTGSDRFVGGLGADTAHYGRAAGVTVDLAAGSATGEGTDALTALENVSGSPGADRLTGSAAANVLAGGRGADVLTGAGHDDSLLGGADDDSLAGGAGIDRCDGGFGTDTATTCEARPSVP